jgi:hypothetical protein
MNMVGHTSQSDGSSAFLEDNCALIQVRRPQTNMDFIKYECSQHTFLLAAASSYITTCMAKKATSVHQQHTTINLS